MSETQSNADNFLKAIEKYAEEQRNQLRLEFEAYKKKELESAESEGLREAYTLIQREMSTIKRDISGRLSRDEMESKKKLFEKRNEMADKVFQKAAQKLLTFTKTSEYEKFLLDSVKKIALALESDDVVLYVKSEDLRFSEKLRAAYTAERTKEKKLADKIKAAFSPSCEIKASKEIKIGGITGRSASLGLIADDTLDTKLDGQREWFYKNSGLKVTE